MSKAPGEPLPRLMVLIGGVGQEAIRAAAGQAEAVLAGGVRLLQLRVKGASQSNLLAIAHTVKQCCDRAGALLIVNDDPSVAAEIGAFGLHLGQTDTPVLAARERLGAGVAIGQTIRSAQEAQQALPWQAELAWAGVGTIFSSSTKPSLSARGPSVIEEVAAILPEVPLFAIGGIGPDNIAPCVEAGAYGVAVSSAILRAECPTEAARRCVAALEETR
ncbi:MAG: thiamine phosphate synthase [Planctomycetota bacterium]|jgi:thiamine-phosphate pyrophosphorylase